MINVGKKLVAHNIQGFLAGQAIFFLLNFNLAERQIWITRHGMSSNVQPLTEPGESTDNLTHKLGGSRNLQFTRLIPLDASLTNRGRKYAKALATFIDCNYCCGSLY